MGNLPKLKKMMTRYMAAFGLAACSFASHSALITQLGTEVSYTYDNTSLLGTGFVVGNSLTFAPTSFSAFAGGPSQFHASNVNLSLQIKVLTPNFALSQLGISQQGDYVLSGENSSVSVQSNYQIDTDLDGVNELSGAIVSDSNLSLNDGLFHNWNALTITSLSAYQSHSIELSLESILSAQTGADGGLAFIAQKLDQIGFSVELENTPISVSAPNTIGLLSMGLLGLFYGRRQQRGA